MYKKIEKLFRNLGLNIKYPERVIDLPIFEHIENELKNSS